MWPLSQPQAGRGLPRSPWPTVWLERVRIAGNARARPKPAPHSRSKQPLTGFPFPRPSSANPNSNRLDEPGHLRPSEFDGAPLVSAHSHLQRGRQASDRKVSSRPGQPPPPLLGDGCRMWAVWGLVCVGRAPELNEPVLL